VAVADAILLIYPERTYRYDASGNLTFSVLVGKCPTKTRTLTGGVHSFCGASVALYFVALAARGKYFNASALKVHWLRQASVLSPTHPGVALMICTRCCSIYVGWRGWSAMKPKSKAKEKRSNTSVEIDLSC
jgi:hypothetical protein